MTADNRERMLRLQAMAAHEVMPAETGIEIRASKGEFHEHILEASSMFAYLDKGIVAIYQINKSRYTGSDYIGEFDEAQISELIALLQKARALMGGV
jgi:hypothetical protein